MMIGSRLSSFILLVTILVSINNVNAAAYCSSAVEFKTANLDCNGQYIYVDVAFYGQPKSCPYPEPSACNGRNATTYSRDICGGKMICKVMALNENFGGDPCINQEKYLAIAYSCSTINPLTLTAPYSINPDELTYNTEPSVASSSTQATTQVTTEVTTVATSTSQESITATATTSPEDNIVSDNNEKSSSSFPKGAIIGIAVGGSVLLLIIVLAAFLIRRRRQQNHQSNSSSSTPRSMNSIELAKDESVYSNFRKSASSLPSEYLALPSRTGTEEIFEQANLMSKVISMSELDIKKQIGKGAFGLVFLAYYRGSEVAVKQIDNVTKKQIEDFVAELKVMLSLKMHPNVVSLIGVCVAPTMSLVLDYMANGSLYNLLQSEETIDLKVQMKIAKGTAAGLLHLHKEGIVHRDVAARNILLDNGYSPKIADFGLARLIQNTSGGGSTVSEVGPLRWMAPECINQRTYSSKSDVWAYGVVLIEIFTRDIPFPEFDPLQVATQVSHKELRPCAPNSAPQFIKELVDTCCQFNPADRPDFVTICELWSKY